MLNYLLDYAPYAAGALVMAVSVAYAVKQHLAFKPYDGPEPVSYEKASALSLSLYGDSISVPCTLQALMPNLAFKNWAVAGTCLTDLALTVPQDGLQTFVDQLRSDPSAVLMCRYGRNDAAFSRDLDLFRRMLETFVNVARAAGKVPVLCSTTQEIITDSKAERRWLEINDAIEETAFTMNVHYFDIRTVPFLPPELPDKVHPNSSYNARVDAFIHQELLSKQVFPDS